MIVPSQIPSISFFFPEQAQAFEHRPIGYGKHDDGGFAREILERMPVPGRDEKTVPRPPGEIFHCGLRFSYARNSLALDDMIDRAAGMAMWSGAFAGRNHLNPTADRRHGCAAG